MVAARSEGVKQLEELISTKVGACCGALTARTRQVKSQLKTKETECTAHQTVEMVHQLTEKSTNDMKANIERTLELGFKLARDQLKHEMASIATSMSEEPMLENVKELMLDETARAEHHIGVQGQRESATAQSEINLATQRQADATPILRDQFQ
ncbi:hypothetical protein PHYBOEH_005977 [Phytophthora boehmeriae]|uniref:Uncharacterized protein n=1 Tax=Phytophthora boehmeriae TaxID=109152 RepID=A0A8T1X9H1_9STRA|nr:hypothetical protein PHYBOEH_005977 [Phytophthora boehmeriae]